MGARKECLLWYASLWLLHGNSWWIPAAHQCSSHASHWTHPARSRMSRTLGNTTSLWYKDEQGKSKEWVRAWGRGVEKGTDPSKLIAALHAWYKIGCSMKNKLFWKSPWQDSVPEFELKITFLSRPTEKPCIIMWPWGEGDDEIAFIEYLISYRHSFKFFTLIIWASEQSYEVGTNISILTVKKKIEAKRGDSRLHR